MRGTRWGRFVSSVHLNGSVVASFKLAHVNYFLEINTVRQRAISTGITPSKRPWTISGGNSASHWSTTDFPTAHTSFWILNFLPCFLLKMLLTWLLLFEHLQFCCTKSAKMFTGRISHKPYDTVGPEIVCYYTMNKAFHGFPQLGHKQSLLF